MAKIQKLSLRRFKGAKSIDISFGDHGERNVVTLIGLNESGKTTILEGISHFATSDEEVQHLFDSYTKREILSFIPIDKKAAFTGRVDIEATAILDRSDHELISEIFSKGGFEVDSNNLPKIITIRKSFDFKDSEFVQPTYGTNWTGFKIPVRKSRRSRFSDYTRPEKSDKSNVDYWNSATDAISNRLPNIAYFPTFLVDLPSRIYLREHEGETATNRYYRKILQNILDSLPNEKISLQTHVVDRIERYRKESGVDATWLSMFFGDPSKRNVDSVFLKMSTKVTADVLGTWSKIFNRPATAKRIIIDWNIDPAKQNLPFATFSVSDGESPYALNERSLGFRWFFSFLLFTRFGGARGRQNLFLFDEPAANLHARAQGELLKSFEKILGEGNSIIYSTHSHHMINPRWLSGAYIVENEAIDYESSGSGTDFSVVPTLITATPYRRFVGENGSRISYFQPVLDRLQYIEPAVASTGKQVLVEGPSDFFALSYAKVRGKRNFDVNIVPGGGAASLDPMIELALSRGVKFLILLDDDAEGRKSKQRYLDIWSLPPDLVKTVADFDPKYSGKGIEAFLSSETIELVRSKFGNAKKKQIQAYMSEAHFSDKATLSAETVRQLTELLEWIDKSIK